jgi:hypothetical protein
MQNINTIELVKLDRTKVLASLDGQLEKIKATDNFSDFKSEYKKFQELKNEFGYNTNGVKIKLRILYTDLS